MTTQPKIYTESDYLQDHLTVLDGPSSWMRSFNQQLMELLKRWGSRAFAVLFAIFEFRVESSAPTHASSPGFGRSFACSYGLPRSPSGGVISRRTESPGWS